MFLLPLSSAEFKTVASEGDENRMAGWMETPESTVRILRIEIKVRGKEGRSVETAIAFMEDLARFGQIVSHY